MLYFNESNHITSTFQDQDQNQFGDVLKRCLSGAQRVFHLFLLEQHLQVQMEKKAAIHNHKTLGIILLPYIIIKFKVTDKLPFINLNLSIFVMYIGCMNGLRYLLQVFMYIANFIAS